MKAGICQKDAEGNWVSAVPVELMCEVIGCLNPVTLDDQYKRVNAPPQWEDESEVLCKEHAVGREVFV